MLPQPVRNVRMSARSTGRTDTCSINNTLPSTQRAQLNSCSAQHRCICTSFGAAFSDTEFLRNGRAVVNDLWALLPQRNVYYSGVQVTVRFVDLR